MVTRNAVHDTLRMVNDPEMPISIVDLGIVEAVGVEGGHVTVDLLPTFVGCHALPAIEDDVRKRLGAVPGVESVAVRFHYDPPWTVDRISPAGREALQRVGITVAGPNDEPPQCPFCRSTDVSQESAFGPTRCKMIYHCLACRNPFEHLKRLGRPALVQISAPPWISERNDRRTTG